MLNRLTVSFFIVIAVLFGCTDKGVQTDSLAPDFSLEDLSGKNFRLSDYRGKVVLLEFWATWCPPCRASMPGLEKLHKTYKDKGLVVLAVSIDDGGWDLVKSFITEHGLTFAVLKGTDEISSKYKVRSIPMTLVLDKEGRIAKRYLGFGGDEELEKDIKTYL